MLNYYVTGMRCDKMMTGENVSNDEWWWSYRTQIMMIALYTNYDDRHDDDDGIVCKWWWWSSSWLHRTQMMMIFIMMMIASWHQDNLTPCVKPDNFTSCIKRTIWHRGKFDTMDFFMLGHVPQHCARTAHRTPGQLGPSDCPIIGRIYQIQIYIFKWHIFPNCWQCISNINVYHSQSPTTRPKGAHTYTLQLTHISRLLAEYFQYLCIMSYSCLGYVSNRPRCQIVCFCKWC